MEKKRSKNIYDLAVIGNGIAAQSFLWNLSMNTNFNGGEPYSIAHLYTEKIAPPCSLRSSATVSLNGVEEDVSPLGNDLREAYYLFENFFNQHCPEGVEKIKRSVLSTNENDTAKLKRRYKALSWIEPNNIKGKYLGIEYFSYVITPKDFLKWMTSQIKIPKDNFPYMVKDIIKNKEDFTIVLQDESTLLTKKILFATGAFSKIFENFYLFSKENSFEEKNAIKSGTYLERDLYLGEKSFYITIDGNLLLYRKNCNENKLIIGSLSNEGAYEFPDIKSLSELLLKLNEIVTFDLGHIKDYSIVTGLRHKGKKRMLICTSLDDEKKIFTLNGLYKNGYSLSFLGAKRMQSLIFNKSEFPCLHKTPLQN